MCMSVEQENLIPKEQLEAENWNIIQIQSNSLFVLQQKEAIPLHHKVVQTTPH